MTSVNPPKHSIWRRFWWLIVLFLCLLIGVAWLISKHQKTPTEKTQTNAQESIASKSGIRVSTSRAAPSIYSPSLHLNGTLVAKEDIAIGTDLSNLRVAEVLVDVGDKVRRGQPLAQLEGEQAQAHFLQIQADLDKAQASLRTNKAQEAEAKATLKRLESLLPQGAVSNQQVDEQRLRVVSTLEGVRSAQAEVEQAKAKATDSRIQRNKVRILAPADGVIAARTAQTGSLAGTTPLFRIIRQGVIELDAQAVAQELALLKVGLPATLTTSSGKTLASKVRIVPPEVNAKSQTGFVRIAPDNSEGLILGSYAEVEIKLPEVKFDVSVPVSAINYDYKGNAFVMLINELEVSDGAANPTTAKVTRQAVTLGQNENGLVEIKQGLAVDDCVVRVASAFLRDGDTISFEEDFSGSDIAADSQEVSL